MTPRTIAWIEQDTDLLDPVMRPLEDAGYHVERLNTIKAALDAVEHLDAADLILLAMSLPPGGLGRQFGFYSGMELLRELREVYQVHTPTLVFTAARDEELYRQLRTLGVAGIIRKPILPSQLRERVEATLCAAVYEDAK